MKRFFCFALSLVFVFGVLFPVTRTSEGKSAFIEDIKKIFGYSPGYQKKHVDKGPAISGDEGTGFFQEIRNVFHCAPKKVEKPQPKKGPFGIFRQQVPETK